MPTWDVRFDLHIDLTNGEVLGLAASAEATAELLRSLPIGPDLRSRLDALNIRRAVRGTTGIEGIEVTEDEVDRILHGVGPVLPADRSRTEREVRNADAAMRYIAEVLDVDATRPLSEALIARIHDLVTAGVDYEHNTPGVYRSHAVRAGDYVPPREHDDVVRLMADFARWIVGPASDLPAAVRAIAAHFYFISVHPFGDGNGRTARAIESYLLYQAGINTLGFYSLANFYYQHRDEYIAALNHARFESRGDLTPFVLFGLRGLVAELRAVQAELTDAMALVAFRDLARGELLGAGPSPGKNARRRYELVIGLMDGPASVADIRLGRHPLALLYRGMTSMTVRRDIEALTLAGLIVVENGAARANLGIVRGD